MKHEPPSHHAQMWPQSRLRGLHLLALLAAILDHLLRVVLEGGHQPVEVVEVRVAVAVAVLALLTEDEPLLFQSSDPTLDGPGLGRSEAIGLPAANRGR